MALTLSRRPKAKCKDRDNGHSFTLKFGDLSAVVTVYEVIDNTKVRVSIDAPPEIQIVRDDAKSTENKHGEHAEHGGRK